MNQQHRPFFQTATTIQGFCRLQRWHAVILSAVLLCSCSILTADRIAILAALAGNAAQIGIELWLRDHPEHRGSIEAILAALSGMASSRAALAQEGMLPPDVPTEEQMLATLPTSILTGPTAEAVLFLSRDSIMVRDKKSGKATIIDAAAREPVLRAIRHGIRRGLTPLPPKPHPLPIRAKETMLPPATIAVISPQDDWREFFKRNPGAIWVITNGPPHGPPPMATNYPPGWTLPIVVESPTPIVPAGKHSVRSRAVYAVERRDGTNWTTVQSLTNQAGEWRVRRVR